jgi:hypothetical protein
MQSLFGSTDSSNDQSPQQRTYVARYAKGMALAILALGMMMVVLRLLDLGNAQQQLPQGRAPLSFTTTHATIKYRDNLNKIDLDAKTPAARRLAIREATRHAWACYGAHAWGYDELRPQTEDGYNFLHLGYGPTCIELLQYQGQTIKYYSDKSKGNANQQPPTTNHQPT